MHSPPQLDLDAQQGRLHALAKAQQRVRSGADQGRRIIDSIQKSADRLQHLLDRIAQGDYDPEDWE